MGWHVGGVFDVVVCMLCLSMPIVHLVDNVLKYEWSQVYRCIDFWGGPGMFVCQRNRSKMGYYPRECSSSLLIFAVVLYR